MFVAKVLVGDFVQGLPKLRKPPEVPYSSMGRCYDSCVNNTTNPTIFVIFEKSQTYPEYLIKYTYDKNYNVSGT